MLFYAPWHKLNAAPGEKRSSESDVIFTRKHFYKSAFKKKNNKKKKTAQLVGDNGPRLKLFVKSK